MRADPLYMLGLNSSLDALSLQQDNLTSELSSGLAVSSPGDDPLAASQGVALGSAIARDDAYVQSATTLEGQLQTSDSALGSAVTEVTSAISLATSGLDGTLNANDLSTISTQLEGIRDQVVSLANTSYAGSYLFSGTAGNTQPYSVDTSTTPATTAYAGDTNSQYSETPSGQQIAVSLPGSSIFSASGADILGSLNNLIADFASGTASSSTQAADMNELSAGLNNLTAQRATLGSSLSTIEQTSSYASTDESNMEAEQSTLVSADAATIATQLSSNETQSQALMSVMSSIGSKSLFDYMQG
jgi:flagellar hook-associated protein 3 FlgL